jgi:hypothetical protein
MKMFHLATLSAKAFRNVFIESNNLNENNNLTNRVELAPLWVHVNIGMEQAKWRQLVQTQAKSPGRTRKRISTKDDDAKTIEIPGAMAKTIEILGAMAKTIEILGAMAKTIQILGSMLKSILETGIIFSANLHPIL